MRKIIFALIGLVLLECKSGGDSQSTADTLAAPKPDSTLLSNTNNDKYVCGFTGSFAYDDHHPLAANLSSANDSAIERTFTVIWTDIIGGRPDAIKIEKDADQNNTEYKYAAAKGSYTEFGNIVRHIFYKSNDLSPLLRRDNGWHLRAIALHEFAHHINGDPFTGVSRDIAELGADDYAGFIMGRQLKTTVDTALLAFSSLTEEHPTNGYPNRQKRIAAVKAGWERGQISPKHSLVAAFIAVKGTRQGAFFNDRDLDFRDIQEAINKNRNIEIVKDTSTVEMARVRIEASNSPGEFFLDSTYLYFKKADSMSIVGRVARSNRQEYREMVYDNFYNYIYISNNNALITYVGDFQDSKRRSKPIVIGILSR